MHLFTRTIIEPLPCQQTSGAIDGRNESMTTKEQQIEQELIENLSDGLKYICQSSLDVLTAAKTQKIDSLKTHKKGLMQQIFPAMGEARG